MSEDPYALIHSYTKSAELIQRIRDSLGEEGQRYVSDELLAEMTSFEDKYSSSRTLMESIIKLLEDHIRTNDSVTDDNILRTHIRDLFARKATIAPGGTLSRDSSGEPSSELPDGPPTGKFDTDISDADLRNGEDKLRAVTQRLSQRGPPSMDKLDVIEADIKELREMITEIRTRISSVSPTPRNGIVSRLSGLVKKATAVAGEVTIRGIPHTFMEFSVDTPFDEFFAKRFDNLSPANLKVSITSLRSGPQTQPATKGPDGVPTFTKMIDGKTTKQIYAAIHDVTGIQPREGPLRIISLVPTTIAMQADKSMYVLLNDVYNSVDKGTYTFRTYSANTLVETDTKKPIHYPKQSERGGSGGPSTLEKSILFLSLEYLDAIRKYLLRKNNTTKGYIALLPSTVVGSMIRQSLFHIPSSGEEPKIAAGKDNLLSMKDLVEAYQEADTNRRIPLILNVATDGIREPVIILKEKTHAPKSVVSNYLVLLSQVYTRFARERSDIPSPGLGLQDTLIGSADTHDFPNFVVTREIRAPKEQVPSSS